MAASPDLEEQQMSTELVQATRGGMDLSTAPWERWNAGMVKLARATVLPKATSDVEVYFCLALAESIGLNPFANEIYFIPGKAKDGHPGKVSAYVGREGLVKRATEYDAWFDADTVRANDTFVVRRYLNGNRSVKHEYGHSAERGDIVGAYAFLHGSRWAQPAFFYAELGQYMPAFDAEWKLGKSPWGNQLSAMIEKCAMIGAGRKRLNLAGVMIDGEIERVEQQRLGQGPGSPTREASEFDWGSLKVPDALRDRLREAVDELNGLVPLSWTPARLEMVLTGLSESELLAQAESIETDAQRARESAAERASAFDEESPVAEPDGPSAAGSESESESIPDAVVVPDAEHAAALRSRLARLEDQMNEPGIGDDAVTTLAEEYERVRVELAAAEDPGQTSLGV